MYSIFRFLFIFTLLGHFYSLQAQPQTWDAARIQLEMQKLNVVGTALYVAAHPDDENTRLITWLANEKKVRTAYISLTRGDGGQNLIGDEKGPLMGLIRTQELVEARKLDGGEQFFTRALDFGYSKTADETFEKWNKDSVLADLVFVIRKLKPDVVVNRFPPNARAGHGHHTASAILSREACEAAADSSRFPESAALFGTWEPKRLFFNNSVWWNPNIAENSDQFVTVNIGAYNPLLGKSYTEIAGESRSKHSSQGFGAAQARGHQLDYLEYVWGVPVVKDAFEAVNLGWTRVEGGKDIGKQIDKILKGYSPFQPQKSVDALIKLYFDIQKMPENHYKHYKLEQCKKLIAACAALRMEYLSAEPYAVVNDSLSVRTEVLSQSGYPIKLKRVVVEGESENLNLALGNQIEMVNFKIKTPSTNTQPYWLVEDAQNNFFPVPQTAQRALPENLPFSQAQFVFDTKQGEITYSIPLQYKWVDPKTGENYRDVCVSPATTVHPEKNTLIFPNQKAKRVSIIVRFRADAGSTLSLQALVPQGWSCKPASIDFENAKAGDIRFASFEVHPEKTENYSGKLRFLLKNSQGETPAYSLQEIDYPHIKPQVVMPLSEITLVSAPLQIRGEHIGYIEGAGDEIPEALRQMGFSVSNIDLQSATLQSLQAYSCIVMGVRAFNTQSELVSFKKVLDDYVHAGGTVVVQYNTNRALKPENIGPLPIALSRKRVTVEEAETEFLQVMHPLFHIPNKIEATDFDGWVQERGLYFADKWHSDCTPLIAWADPGEEKSDGALVLCHYGQGAWMYTGISFFRQLPAGVPGAYRLFANLVSYKPPVKTNKL
jgi:LmbE family N-acetylglucosaminyl deacetylase